MNHPTHQLKLALTGCLLGTALGDATGLKYEGLPPKKIQKYNLNGPQFLSKWTPLSDDTEHASLTAQAYLSSQGNPELFAQSMQKQLRLWLLSLPLATGWATLRACIKLCLGHSWKTSGVFSAGNGPMMRCPILGVLLPNQPEKLKQLVYICTKITHTDPKAYWASLAIANASALASQKCRCPQTFLQTLQQLLTPNQENHEFYQLLQLSLHSAQNQEPLSHFCQHTLQLHKGISGYAYHTLPAILQVWFRQKDFTSSIHEIIQAGGDTDTTAAILGAIAGAYYGPNGLPQKWLQQLKDWPLTKTWLEHLAHSLAHSLENPNPPPPPKLPFPALLLRNLTLFPLALALALGRIFP